jgi:hypothetical protein
MYWVLPFSVCQAADFNPDPESASYKTMLAWYWSYWLCIGSIIDTFIFVARKKFNRVTKIHTATYSMGIIFTWVHTRYVPSGTEAIDMMLINLTMLLLTYTLCWALQVVISGHICGGNSTFTTLLAAQGPPSPIISLPYVVLFYIERKCII